MPNTRPTPQIRRYQEWLRTNFGLSFQDYSALWHWSVTDLEMKKLFLGHPAEKVISRETMANPQCVDWYIGQARATFSQSSR
jgi:hypothetical protein